MEYEKIVKSLSTEKIKNLLYSLGATNINENDEVLITNTICHNVDPNGASMKLYWYKDSKMFYCFTECGSMNIFTFLKHYYEERGISYDWYRDIYLVARDCANVTHKFGESVLEKRLDVVKYKSKRDVSLKPYSKEVLDLFEDKLPKEWLEEGISAQAMRKYGIKFWGIENKIIIPHVDYKGNLVGIRGRALNPEDIEFMGKYMPVKIEGKYYSHPLSLNLYGLYENKENIKKHGVCYLFESEKSVLLSENSERDNCALAVCGSNINKYQIFLLLKICQPKEIIVCFDNEEKEGEEKYFHKLYKMCKRYSKYCAMSFCYDRKNITKKKDSPIDRGEEIFNELVKRRVRVRA